MTDKSNASNQVVGGVTLGDIFGGITNATIAGRDVHIYQQDSQVIERLFVKAISDFFPKQTIFKADVDKADDFIQIIKQVRQAANQQGESDDQDYYLLGMIYVGQGALELAEACFLAALEVNPQLGKAHLGLALIWQLYANELIRHPLFRPAEELLNKSEEYLKKAREYQDDDPSVYVQLGYTYKDLSQAYNGASRKEKAQASFKKAMVQFKMALGVDAQLASAYNGLGSLYLIQRDYDNAIVACKKAIEIQPSYLFAHFDLAIAYYGKAWLPTTMPDQVQTLLEEFLRTYATIVELDGKAGNLPPTARQDIDNRVASITTADDGQEGRTLDLLKIVNVLSHAGRRKEAKR